VVSSVGECTTGSETMMVGVGGIVLLVVEDERRTLTFRLFVRPNPAKRDREAIAVEFVRTCRNSNTEGVDGSSWVLVSPTLKVVSYHDILSFFTNHNSSILGPNSENDQAKI